MITAYGDNATRAARLLAKAIDFGLLRAEIDQRLEGTAYLPFWQILLQKSKIEQPEKISRELILGLLCGCVALWRHYGDP